MNCVHIWPEIKFLGLAFARWFRRHFFGFVLLFTWCAQMEEEGRSRAGEELDSLTLGTWNLWNIFGAAFAHSATSSHPPDDSNRLF